MKLDDSDLQALQSLLMKTPERGDLMVGTGGLRKVRFAPPSMHTGKSSALRVVYTYFRVDSTVYLISLFAKKDQGNLTAAQKIRFKAMIEGLAKFHVKK